MTHSSVQDQIETIKKVTEKILQSKEATLKFLQDAGILNLKEEKNTKGIKVKK